MSEQILKFGIPAGSLQKATVDLFNKAGFHIGESSRSYFPSIDDKQIQLAKALSLPKGTVKLAHGPEVAKDVVFFYAQKN